MTTVSCIASLAVAWMHQASIRGETVSRKTGEIGLLLSFGHEITAPPPDEGEAVVDLGLCSLNRVQGRRDTRRPPLATQGSVLQGDPIVSNCPRGVL